jgi:hypothetical protein
MMTRPTTAQLVEAVRRELSDGVAPVIDDPRLQANLTMIDSILASVAVRCRHEIAWIVEEICEIEAAGDEAVTAGVAGSDAVAEALGKLRANRADSLHLDDLLDDYDRAGEVLSLALEAVMPVGGELRDRVEALLDSRMARAVTIRGEFSLAGRE